MGNWFGKGGRGLLMGIWSGDANVSFSWSETLYFYPQKNKAIIINKISSVTS
jgi:hypothetical protein